MADAVRAAVPDRQLFVYCSCSAVGHRNLAPNSADCSLGFAWLSPASDLPTVRIAEETMITVRDYTSGRPFDDSLCHSFYPIDLHDLGGLTPRPVSHGKLPIISRGVPIPKVSRNIMVSGRCVFSGRSANSPARVQAKSVAMGPAAAVTATLAARLGVTPGEFLLTKIHEELRRHVAIIPEGTRAS